MEYHIIQTDHIQCDPEWQWVSDRNGWSGYHLWCVIGGGAVVRKEQERFQLSVGDCFFFDLSKNHYCTHNPSCPLQVETVYLHSDRILSPTQFHICGNTALNSAIRRCVSLHRRGNRQEARIWLAAAISEFLLPQKEESGLEEKRMEKWCSWIESSCQSPFSLDAFCDRVGYSKNQVIRIFKAYVGKTPYQYYIWCKIQKSLSLLLYTNRTISEISAYMGFYDAAHFSRCFKGEMGYSPTQIRKK